MPGPCWHPERTASVGRMNTVTVGKGHIGANTMDNSRDIGLIEGRHSALASMAMGWVLAMAVLVLCMIV